MKVNLDFEIITITSVVLELWTEILWKKKLLFTIDKTEYNVDKNMISIDWNGFFLVKIHQYIDYNKPNEIYVCMGGGGASLSY